jgi:linoleate 8R-lipoxygenase/9,12-octadecadienoate 8-hydroperoxide 8R-isomerase
VFYKLFLRAFPNHFKPNSVYALSTRDPVQERGDPCQAGDCRTVQLGQAWSHSALTFITSYTAAKTILDNQTDFKVTWGEAIKFLMQHDRHPYGTDFMLSGTTRLAQDHVK